MRGDRIDRHRDEGVYVSRVQKDKKEKGKYQSVPPKNDKQILKATFFTYLKKLFDAFSPSKKIAGKVIDFQTIVDNLQKFKKILHKLGQKDLSTSADFAEELSTAWTILLEDFDNIEIMERRNLAEVAGFREMMDTIKNHPPESEHRFGYYLLQQAGKDWLPFPFIEMLEKLHVQYKESPDKNTLKTWINLIDKVISNLQGNLPFTPPSKP